MVWAGITWSGAILEPVTINKYTATGFPLLTHPGVQQESQAEKQLPRHLKYNKKKLRSGKNKNLTGRGSTPPKNSHQFSQFQCFKQSSIYHLFGGRGGVFTTHSLHSFSRNAVKLGYFFFLSLVCGAESDSHLENSPYTELFSEQLT